MKKVYGIILLVLGLFLITGCTMKSNFGLEVSKDGVVSSKILMAYDNEMIDGLMSMGQTDDAENKTHTDAERWAYLEENVKTNETYKDYKKEKYDKDGFKGYIFTAELGKIDDLVIGENEESSELDKIGADSKLFKKNGDLYIMSIKGSQSEDIKNAEQYEKMGAVLEIQFSVKLPNKAKKNNATNVEGTTYTWNLLKSQDIQLEFDLKPSNNILLYVGIGAGVLIVCAVVVCIILGKKKKEVKN